MHTDQRFPVVTEDLLHVCVANFLQLGVSFLGKLLKPRIDQLVYR